MTIKSKCGELCNRNKTTQDIDGVEYTTAKVRKYIVKKRCKNNFLLQVNCANLFNTAQQIEDFGLSVKDADSWKYFPEKIRILFSSERDLQYFDSSIEFKAVSNDETLNIEFTEEFFEKIRGTSYDAFAE